MIYIKLDEDMNLVITKNEPIYRGDHMNRKITYLIPITVGDIDMLRATVYLSYIRADGTADIALLVREDEPYNERYYKYHLPITSTLSRYPGEICTFMQIFSGPPRHPVIAKSGECMLQVIDSKNMDEYISDRNLRLIYELQRYMEDKVENTEAALNERIDRTEEVVAAKADNIVFDPEDSAIQLVSTIEIKDEEGNTTGEYEKIPLGDRIFVRADTARGIINMEINEGGDLIVTFDDGETQNLGTVVGKDGSVYVPHVDAHKVLTFTVETEPGEVPDPVDLNPNDEWTDIDESGMDIPGNETGYVWEDM